MTKTFKIVVLLFLVLVFLYSCTGQKRAESTCVEKFKMARSLASSNPIRQSALDSALYLTNESVGCDSIRRAVIDFKVTLLLAMKKYDEDLHFIDSLKQNDFAFGYKRLFLYSAVKAFKLDTQKDTAARNKIYLQMSKDLEHYINNNHIDNKEFKEIYTDLFSVKEKFQDANQMNTDIEALKKRYPDQQIFFDFFRKD